METTTATKVGTSAQLWQDGEELGIAVVEILY
jgi:hypothetical protein